MVHHPGLDWLSNKFHAITEWSRPPITGAGFDSIVTTSFGAFIEINCLLNCDRRWSIVRALFVALGAPRIYATSCRPSRCIQMMEDKAGERARNERNNLVKILRAKAATRWPRRSVSRGNRGPRKLFIGKERKRTPRMEFRLIAVTLASRGWTRVHDVAGFKRWGSENKSVASDQPSWKDPLFPLCVRKNPPAVYNCQLAICARLSFEVYRATLFLHGSSVTVNLCKRCINNGKSGKVRRESRHFSCELLNGQVFDVRSHLLWGM